MKKLGCIFVCLMLVFGLTAQQQTPQPASKLIQKLKKLNVLGSVLYVAAHPDDENTRLIAYLANGKQYRTGYISLTRGDGGQNLIGDEQGIELGLIRTYELMAARNIDGGEQFFTRAYDFGFSKSPQETFTKWDREEVLSDVVWVVRNFQPDIIITRFPEDSRAGHGHHSASGILAREAFDAAANPARFPEQLKNGVTTWQAKRLLWNTFNFGGAANTIDSTQLSLDAGGFNPLLGLSYGEMAGDSRSQHKSQGFGVPRARGIQREFFVTISGDKPTQDILDGVDISWGRMPLRFAGEAEKKAWVQATTNLVNTLVKSFNPQAPYEAVPGLIQLHKAVSQDALASTWRTKKLAEIEEILLDCIGFYAEAIMGIQFIPEQEKGRIVLNLINRSPLQVKTLTYHVNGNKLDFQKELPNNQNVQRVDTVAFAFPFFESQPYWLRNGIANELFDTRDQQLIGKPVNDPLKVNLEIEVEGYTLAVKRPIQYKFTDPVKGELYQPVFITPRHLVYSNNDIIIFKKGQKDSARIRAYVSSWEQVKDKSISVELKSPSFFLSQHDTRFSSVSNGLSSYEYKIPNYLEAKGLEKDELSIDFSMDGQSSTNAQRTIQYDHIPTLRHYYQDKIKVLNIDLKLSGKRVGYIEGAGDRVSSLLEAMGYLVEILKEEDLTETNLKKFDAIVTGVRAYNVHEYLTRKYDALMKFVENGGNLIVQYNTSSQIGPVKAKMSPFSLGIGRTRVTDENSPVKFLLPDHPALNFPNKITQKDFEGWKQERSIYHGNQYDSVFKAPLALKDFGESEESGSLLIAPYGKGNFVYTGLVFFRQMPAGVPGAYRLMANLIGLPKN